MQRIISIDKIRVSIDSETDLDFSGHVRAIQTKGPNILKKQINLCT